MELPQSGERRPFPRPEIPPEKLTTWQRLLDDAARRLGVPVGLVKQAEFERMVVLVANEGSDHPFRRGQSARLDSGIYCETVAARREVLRIPNALADARWSSGPGVRLGFVSYLGAPLLWPDGSLFGTLCVLDRKENEFGREAQELLADVRASIEGDLATLS